MVVRRSKGREELGVLIDSRSLGLTGRSSTVYLTCLFELPASFPEFLTLPRDV
ncbi:MAG: hypothetical protein U0792_19635 [Gemmataceae bacterium]